MKRTRWEKTRASPVAIAGRKAPEPNGRPGFVRVDTVHPGDRDGRKGVYVVHMVDEVTQYEHVGAVPGISERFMAPMLEALLLLFPFDVPGFHADNGSEYINRRVAALLNKLHVGELTKSRPRHSNDNAPPSSGVQAPVEGKNAHVVCKPPGHEHIPVRFAGDVDRFAREHLRPRGTARGTRCFAATDNGRSPRLRRFAGPSCGDPSCPLCGHRTNEDPVLFTASCGRHRSCSLSHWTLLGGARKTGIATNPRTWTAWPGFFRFPGRLNIRAWRFKGHFRI